MSALSNTGDGSRENGRAKFYLHREGWGNFEDRHYKYDDNYGHATPLRPVWHNVGCLTVRRSRPPSAAAELSALGQSMPSSSLWSQPGSFWLGAFMLAEAPIGLVVAFLDVEHRIIVLDYLFSSPLTIVCAIVGVVAVGLLTGWLGHRLGLGA